MSGEAIPVVGARTRRRVPPVLVIFSVAVLVVVTVCTIFGELIAPYPPNAQDLSLGVTGPSFEHWFGTDDLGRDIFSRVIVGARLAVVGPLIVAVSAMALGTALGLLAGFRGGKVDSVLMRWVDLMFAFPGFLIAVVVIGIVGGGYWAGVLVLAILTAPFDTRLIRGAALEQKPRPYVEAARTAGLSQRRIMFGHIGPNITPLILANTFLTFAVALVALASLSFLGIGSSPGAAEWGRMVADNKPLLFVNGMSVIGPGLAIVLTATAMNLMGDHIYERVSDQGRAR